MEATWHHAAISANDLDRLLYFYRDLMGFEVEWERPNYSGEAFSNVVGLPQASAHVVMLKGHGTRLELFHYHSPQGAAGGPKRQCDFGLTHMTFSVKKIHEIYDFLSKHCIQFNSPPQNLRTGVWAAYMKDPEGNTIELVEYL